MKRVPCNGHKNAVKSILRQNFAICSWNRSKGGTVAGGKREELRGGSASNAIGTANMLMHLDAGQVGI